MDALPTDPEVSLAQLAAIVNGCDDAILSKGLDGQIQSWNPAACGLFGYSAEEIIGQSIMRIIPPELHEQEQQVLQGLKRGEHLKRFETIRLAKSGEPIAVSLTISPVRSAQGAIIGVSSIARDMRGREREKALQEEDRRKSDFIALLGHELRNAVAPIGNASEVLARMLHNPPQALHLIELLRRQAGHIARLVDDMLDMTRINHGRITLHCRALPLSEVVAQEIEAASPMMEAKHHHGTFSACADEVFVNADETRLRQCIANLLANAAKFTDPGGRIQVAIRREGNLALIEVSDNGCGISADLLPRVFDLYFQTDRTSDRTTGGLGIGLSVVKRLVELQHGSVRALSDGPARGATFQIRLPTVPAPQPTGEASMAASGSRRIVIVDDNVDGATTLALLLRAEGHRVQVIHSAREALGQIDAAQPDVVLIDIGLPQMNGYELLEYLRSRQGLRDTKFIALTGYPQEEARSDSQQVTFDAYLLKPMDADRLTRTLQELQSRSNGA